MRRTTSPRFVSSVAFVAALCLIAVGCGDDEATGDPTVTQTGDSSEVATTPAASGDDVQTSTGMVDEPGNPEVSVSSIADPNATVGADTSDNIQEYIDSLAATTDNFDGLTTTPEETTCAAAAVLTPIGVEVLQSHDVSVEHVDLELDLLEFATPDSAVGIADGLVACGLGPRFAAALAESETAEDLDEAGQLALRDCVREKLDDATARMMLVGFLTPSTNPDETDSSERTDAGSKMADMVRDCGVDARFYP